MWKEDRPLNTGTPDRLDTTGNAAALQIAPYWRDGTLRHPVPIWVVRVGDDLYVRSWRGTTGRWYRVAQQTHDGHICARGLDQDVTFVDADGGVTDALDDAEPYISRMRFASEHDIYSTAVAYTLLGPCGEDAT